MSDAFRCVPFDDPGYFAFGVARIAVGDSQPMASFAGHWSNVDVHITCDAAWVAANVNFKLYGLGGGKRTLLAQVDLAGADLESDLRGLLLQVRGHPVEEYELVASSAAAVATGANFIIECWGTESTPVAVGNSPGYSGGVKDTPVPSQAARLQAYDAATDTWKPLKLGGAAADGALLVSSGAAGSVVVGNNTPADSYANPTDAVDVNCFLSGLNTITSTWERLRAQTPGDAMANPYVGLETIGRMTGWNGVTWDRLRARTIVNGTQTSGIGLDTNALQVGVEAASGNLYRFNIVSFGSLTQARTGISHYDVGQPFFLDATGNIMQSGTAKLLNQSAMVTTEYGQQVAAQLYGIDSTNVVKPLSMERATNILRVQPSIPMGEVAEAAKPSPFRATAHATGGPFTGVIHAGPGRVFSLRVTSRQDLPA